MAFAGMCPYLKDARSCERTVCECARFTFPDVMTRRELLYKFCGHPTGWRECTFKTVLDGYYDRKYSSESSVEQDVQNTRKKQGVKGNTNGQVI